MKKLFLIIALAVNAIVFSSHAHGITVGGYDVAKIAVATVDVMNAKKIITDAEAKDDRGRIASIRSGDPLVAAAPIVDLYEKLFARLVDKGVASKDDIAAIRKTAAAGGGLKIGGLNPVVLAASCLDILAKKGLLTPSEAQAILDSSTTGQRKSKASF